MGDGWWVVVTGAVLDRFGSFSTRGLWRKKKKRRTTDGSDEKGSEVVKVKW